MIVEWDEEKASSNLEKHGVSFDAAAELLVSDDDCLEIYDEEHSVEEDRFISIGQTRSRVLVVVWTERDADVVRIISARLATQTEEERFLAYMRKWQ